MNREIIIEKLEHWAKCTPNKPAIKYRNSILSYKEFYNKVEIIKNNILKKTFGKNIIVPIRVSNDYNALIVIYALVKANAAYLPLPKEITSDKCRNILEEIDTTFYITDFDSGIQTNKEGLSLEELLIPTEKIEDSRLNYDDENYFYLMYTSGTTGKPKGCLIKDRSICDRLTTLDELFPFQQEDKYLFSTNYSFDVSLTEIFGWIFGGGTVLVYDRKMSASELPKLIYDEKITHIAFAPSFFKTFFNKNTFENFKLLKYLFLAGEKLDLDFAKKICEYIPKVDAYNLYGPTETTIYATYFNLKEIKDSYTSVPIGKTLKNTKILIEKSEEEIGEILIGGTGVSEGYYKNDKLNKEKFIYINSEKYYRSGDLGKISDDGNILFYGRKDNQIKINGIRVEAEEIELAIKKIIPISSVVVRLINIEDKKILVAFLETDRKNIDFKEIQNRLEEKIERYFIPKIFLSCSEFPLDKNKKINFRELEKKLILNLTKKKEVAIKNNLIENQIIDIWKNILKIEIDSESDFFLSGGDSLDTITLILELEKNFNIKVLVEDIMKNSKLKELAKFIALIKERNDEKKFLEYWKDKKIISFKICNSEKTIYVNNSLEKSKILESIKGVDIDIIPDRVVVLNKEKKDEKRLELKIPYLAEKLKNADIFPLFSRQEFYLRKNFNQCLVKSIEIEGLKIEKILNTINKLIENQILFRTTISNGEFYEKEFKPLKISDVNYYDFSDYEYNEYLDKEKGIIAITLDEFKNLEIQNRFLYDILLIKKSLKKFKVIFFINHHIIDGYGLNLLEKNFIDIFYDKPLNIGKNSYKEFIKDVIEINNDEKISKLKKAKYFNEIKNSVEYIKKNLVIKDTKEYVEFIIDNEEKAKQKRGDILFDSISNFVYELTGIKKQVYQVLKNLDEFNGKNYSSQIGDFHVSIFLPFECELEKGLFTKSEDYFRKIYTLEGYHLDYLCSSNKYYLNEDMNIFEQIPLSINYLGELAEEEVESWKSNLNDIVKELSKLHSSKIRITCFNCKNKGYIYFLNGVSN